MDVDESEDLVFGDGCEITWGSVYNTHSAAIFLKFYDASSEDDVTVGTTAPTLTIAVPATSSVTLGPVSFTEGVVVAATANAVDSDTTAPAAAVVLSLATT